MVALAEIDFSWLAECDSTSRVLKELTKETFDSVKIIAAGRQTAGSGTQGRVWQSPVGNLYLSIALPENSTKNTPIELIPLVVGIAVARWIESHTGVRPVLKWPNDVILDGLKVGGILCEGSFSGTQWRGAVIGIGVNLSVAPSLPAGSSEVATDDQYRAGDLRSLTGFVIDPRVAAQSVGRSLVETWHALSENNSKEEILDHWTRLAVARNHGWVQPGIRSLALSDGLSSEGYLKLISIPTGQRSVVSSAVHDLKWAPLIEHRVLVADIGNSRIKLGWSDGETVSDILSVDRHGRTDTGQFIDALQKLISAHSLAPIIHAVSVNPDGLKWLTEVLAGRHILVRQITKNPVRLVRSKYNLAAMGADRLAFLEAVTRSHQTASLKIKWPAVLVSCGTATTVDVINHQGVHLGGYIIPGVQTGLDALGQRGALLPRLDAAVVQSPGPRTWPISSEEAILEGAWLSVYSFIKAAQEKLLAEMKTVDARVAVVITGGFADLLKARFPDDPDFVYAPDAVLQGAAILALNGR